MPDSFQKTLLPNGVRVISEHIPSVRSISVGVWIDAGSRDESDAESGMCHFIEHMVFKGTKKRRMHHIAQRMENVGGYLNAFTSKEYTCFYARSLDEHLPRALDTVIDLVHTPTFPEKEIEKEKDVIVEEMKMYEDTPDDRIFDHLDKALYPGSTMGRPIIGTEETVRSFTKDGLMGFLDRKYIEKNTIVAIAGNVDHKKAVKLVEKYYYNPPKNALPAARTDVSSYNPTTFSEKRPVQQAHLIVGTRAYDVHDPKRVALSVLNTILGGGMSSRLNQNIRERYGYCYNIYSFNNLHSDVGDFGVYMGTDASKVDHSVKLIFKEFDKLLKKSVTKTELDRAKSQAKGSIMLGLESMGSRMMRIGRQELYYQQYHSLDSILAMIEGVTLDDIVHVAEEILQPDRYSVLTIVPETVA